MAAHSETFRLSTKRGPEARDITREVTSAVAKSGIRDGLACVFTPSSTSAILTNEFEPGLMAEDIPAALERLFPESLGYGHERRWGDGNGYAHVRASLLGSSLVVPFSARQLQLGTWQQIIVADFDNRPRSREIVLQIIGE